MGGRIAWIVVACTLAASAPLDAQRPWLSFGFGGGLVLGTPLLEHDVSIRIDDRDVLLAQQVDLEEMIVYSANLDVFVTSRIALRTHASRGSGNLRIATRAALSDDGFAQGTRVGSVDIRTVDAGISFWPWPPGTVGIAPFVTVGLGRFTYDIDASSDADFFHATDTRSGDAFLLGVGADLHVWRSFMLRFEAVNHRADSPLRPRDFRFDDWSRPSSISDSISNVRLDLTAQFFLPFRSNTGAGGS